MEAFHSPSKSTSERVGLMSRATDLTSRRFERLVVQHEAGRDKGGRAIWWAKCDCGSVVRVMATNLMRGQVRSCGCLRRERSAAVHHRHGHNKRGDAGPSREYLTWLRMKARCCNANNPDYPAYGGRGVRLHPAWQQDFVAFLAYLHNTIGPHPGKGYSVDRIDNESGYVPGNIRWATAKVQANNRRQRHR